jgi:hypothetical protein
MPPHCRVFKITLYNDITCSRTPLDKGLACHRDLYLKTRNIDKRQTSMPLAGFKPKIPSSKQLQTHDLDHVATAVCWSVIIALI